MALFGNKKEEQYAKSSSNIGKGSIMKGDLETQGNVRIEGEFKGNIYSKSKVVIGEGAILNGDISSKNAEIEGNVTGEIRIKNILLIKPKANIKGNIFTTKLILEEGAKFNGQCTMNENINNNESTKNIEDFRQGKVQVQ